MQMCYPQKFNRRSLRRRSRGKTYKSTNMLKSKLRPSTLTCVTFAIVLPQLVKGAFCSVPFRHAVFKRKG